MDNTLENTLANTELPSTEQPLTTVEPMAPQPVAPITLKTLLEAGAHFGHQTSRWSPLMAPYIYGVKNGIHIINLPKTVVCWKAAREAVVNTVAKGGTVLFVGTKKQAQSAVIESASKVGAFYIAHRWLGGMLTNFQTIRKSVERLKKNEAFIIEEEKLRLEGKASKFTKKERLMVTREVEKLNRSLGGIKDMTSLPSMLFVIDTIKEHLAVSEAIRCGIPVVALVDTNCDPRPISHPIPANDDGTRAIKLFCESIADAITEGKKRVDERRSYSTEGHSHNSFTVDYKNS